MCTLTPRGFKRRDDEVVSFTYLQRVDPIRLVFEVETEEKDILHVKCTQRYGAEAHRRAHELGIALELVAYDDTLPGGWKMVVMKPIPKGYVEIDSIKWGSEEQGKVRALVIAQMQRYLDEGFVHGDLRAANIFVDGEVIDHDWAGRNKEVSSRCAIIYGNMAPSWGFKSSCFRDRTRLADAGASLLLA